MGDFQSVGALVIVGITVGVFAYRLLRKKPGACGGGCACSVKPKGVDRFSVKEKTPE